MSYIPCKKRYEKGMQYTYCGNSGLLLPRISLGLWHNFGSVDDFGKAEDMVRFAFDCGITHFDLANNYGPEPGSAESNFGKILKKSFQGYRDEMIISSKAGHLMWPGPYGDGSSRKYLMASLDQSLKRMGLDYVDIFYSHRPDPETPIEETMGALADIVKQGKALYVGISNYNDEQTAHALAALKEHRVPCLIHQAKYSMLERWSEPKLLPLLEKEGVGLIAFSPLAQGLLTNRYLNGIPEDSRAARSTGFLQIEQVGEVLEKIKALNEIAANRGQSLAEMALSWLLKDERVTSVLIGASSVKQLMENLKAMQNINFTENEISVIDNILK